MSRVLVCIFVIGALATAAVPAQAPQSEGPTLQPLWTLMGDFAAPESAFYDAASNAIFVSSINGQIREKDGNGYISRLSPDGKMVSAKWVTGLNAPKGLRSLGATLWVTDIDEVVSIDIATTRITARVKVEGASFSTSWRHPLMARSTPPTRLCRASSRSRTGSPRSSSRAPTSSISRMDCWWTGRAAFLGRSVSGLVAAAPGAADRDAGARHRAAISTRSISRRNSGRHSRWTPSAASTGSNPMAARPSAYDLSSSLE